MLVIFIKAPSDIFSTQFSESQGYKYTEDVLYNQSSEAPVDNEKKTLKNYALYLKLSIVKKWVNEFILKTDPFLKILKCNKIIYYYTLLIPFYMVSLLIYA